MTFRGMVAAAALACAAGLSTTAAGAQVSTPEPARVRVGGTCSSGLVGGGPDCAVERRLAIDVRVRGTGLPERRSLLGVVGIGAAQAGVFFLPFDVATSADSALYAVVEIERGVDFEFRIETRLAGPGASTSAWCNRTAAGRADDMSFGAMLAFDVSDLARCAQARRAANR